MKNLFVAIIIAIISISAVSAQGLTVHLEGGKCNKFTEEVTYKTVIAEYDSYRRLTYLECTGKGHEQCPPSWTYDQPQSTFEKSILEATVLMEVQILEDLNAGKNSGEFKYKYITLSYKNAKLVTNESGKQELQYDWSITDFRTVRDVADIKKYKETIEKQKE
ncbi:MAG: hypothetical protein J6T48_11335 [Bacteroidales bacterium]|nr:hypothetical protein [Bacteroidales bacterium]MBO7572730.1 hypothetical protein [Bacteroidales bacterium]